jgi:hypothetical protein
MTREGAEWLVKGAQGLTMDGLWVAVVPNGDAVVPNGGAVMPSECEASVPWERRGLADDAGSVSEGRITRFTRNDR